MAHPPQQAAPAGGSALRGAWLAAAVGLLLAAAAVPAPLPASGAGGTTANAAALLDPAQLDQLTAPIALYPDALLGDVLVAATYPLEVVEADRWLQAPANARLRGEQLRAALDTIRWDDSVKALIAYPSVLAMLDAHLDWMELLGDTFLAQQGAVMDSIQRLRERAAASGALLSTPQQNVSELDGAIDIEPASVAGLSVPSVDPESAYGSWPWPDDPPFVFLEPGTMPGLAPPVPPLEPLSLQPRWHWRRHQLDWAPKGLGGAVHPWRHDPTHRLGVPYRSSVLAARYQARSQAAWRQRQLAHSATRHEALPQPARSASPAPGLRPPVTAPLPDSTGRGDPPARSGRPGPPAGVAVQRPSPATVR